MRQDDIGRPERGEYGRSLVDVLFAGEKLGLDRVGLQDVDQPEDLGLFRPWLVLELPARARRRG